MEFVFNQHFGRKWYRIEDKTFTSILFAVLAIALLMTIYVGSRDYHSIQAGLEDQIRSDYLSSIQQLYDIRLYDPMTESVESPIPDMTIVPEIKRRPPITSTRESRKALRKQIQDEIDREELLQSAGSSNVIEDLPFDEPEIAAIIPLTGAQMYSRGIIRDPGNGPTRMTEDINESDIFDPLEYRMARQGASYLAPTSDMIDGLEQEHGWRDTDEITMVINEYEPVIEYCYEREAQRHPDLDGYIVVRFKVAYSGIVEAASVQIIQSTLRNRRVEQCIKRAIQRMRKFSRLDERYGSVTIVQKFIFN
jgi:hypothetical protein